METKRLFVEGIKTDSGKVYISSKEIGREIDRIKGNEPTLQENNIIELCDNPQFKMVVEKWDFSEYEYVDTPNENEFEPPKILSRIVTCIKDGTKIIERRKGGKTR